jgi:hypothetical protein
VCGFGLNCAKALRKPGAAMCAAFMWWALFAAPSKPEKPSVTEQKPL